MLRSKSSLGAGMPKSVHTEQYQRFCALITAARKQSGLTQANLAEKLDRPQSFVSKYESGERRLDVVEFLEVMKALGVSFAVVTRFLRKLNPK